MKRRMWQHLLVVAQTFLNFHRSKWIHSYQSWATSILKTALHSRDLQVFLETVLLDGESHCCSDTHAHTKWFSSTLQSAEPMKNPLLPCEFPYLLDWWWTAEHIHQTGAGARHWSSSEHDPPNMLLCHVDYFELKTLEKTANTRIIIWLLRKKAGDEIPMWKMSSWYQKESNALIIKDKKLRPGEFYTNRLC